MTDNEIIKALGYCSNVKGPCQDCPFKYEKEYCVLTMTKHALDLIKRQQAEIEMLEHIKEELSRDVKRLWKDCDFFEDKAKNTAKVFAEKLKAKLWTPTETWLTDDIVTEAQIDEVLKEMVGANDDL